MRNNRPARAPADSMRLEPLEPKLLFSVIFVDHNAPGPTHDGMTWTTAYRRLTPALNNAVAGDVIRMADGTYTPTNGTNQAATFQLKNGVEVDGGFAGYGATNPDDRDIAANPTILSGEIGNPDDNLDNSYHVVTGSGTNASAVLDGVGIVDGTAVFVEAGSGGGVYNNHGSPTIRDCSIGDSFSGSGGAVADENQSSPTFIGCSFFGSTGSAIGGAMLNRNSSATLTTCTFIHNDSGTNGGAIYNDNSQVSITSCSFLDNQGGFEGGAIFDSGGTTTMTNCLFVRNGVLNRGGAILQTSGAHAVIDNCTFRENGINYDGQITDEGGAIYERQSSAVVIDNSILWGNRADAHPEVRKTSGSTVVVQFTDYQGGHAGQGNINLRPLFIAAPNPGPDGIWGSQDDFFGNENLKSNSPCLDAGSNALVPAGVTTDLAGRQRIVDMPGAHDPGAIVDMGAYEFQPTSVTGDSSQDGSILFGTVASASNPFSTTGTPSITGSIGAKTDQRFLLELV